MEVIQITCLKMARYSKTVDLRAQWGAIWDSETLVTQIWLPLALYSIRSFRIYSMLLFQSS